MECSQSGAERKLLADRPGRDPGHAQHRVTVSTECFIQFRYLSLGTSIIVASFDSGVDGFASLPTLAP